MLGRPLRIAALLAEFPDSGTQNAAEPSENPPMASFGGIRFSQECPFGRWCWLQWNFVTSIVFIEK